ncbi:MAG: DUF4833 domain-containing protein [Endomicrobiaceae bacterium]|nr:DUF4833 domain-containing protein [Endomicrobiaceae bacterium]
MKYLLTLFTILTFVSVSFAQQQGANNRLFIIERSKNANVVCYDANITKDGEIDKEKPVDAYWIMYAENAGRQEIGAFEKRAYGFKINYNESTKDFDFSLKAVESKNMNIIMVDGNPKVKIMINNTESYLNKVYIQSKDGPLGIPKVYYYVLYGTTIASNENIEEKIILKK